MRTRVERLRLWLLAGAGLLVAVLAVFIGSARYMKRHFLARLPARLGVNIKSETNGFTYSQSLQGRTIYTLHAAKEIEHSNGVITLHDVSMILYGRTGDRADRVYGKEFEYDQNAGVVRAVGLVHIDLGAAGSGDAGSATAKDMNKGEDDAEGGPKLLHATTSGLVYLEKLGIAATSEAIDFETGQMKGHAIGADYNTDTGTLLLHSAVSMSGTAGGRAVAVMARTAQLDNRGQRALLTHGQYVSAGEEMQADEATLLMNPDSSLKRVQARGNVVMEARGGRVDAASADVTMAAKSRPQLAVLTGGVRYTDDGPLRQARGRAAEARVAFDANGAPGHALFSGGVEMIERTRAVENGKAPWSVRDLEATTVDALLVPVSKGRSELSKLVATGAAHLTVVDNGATSAAAARGTAELSGDGLTAHLLPGVGAKQTPTLDTLAAQGHTVLRQVSPAGVVQTSTGDTLDAQFRAGPGAGSGARRGPAVGPADELASAVQDGHVHMTRQVPAVGTGPGARQGETDDAVASRAAYDGDSDRLHLTGGVRLTQGESTLWANEVVFARETGDAQADGAVKVSYVQPGQTTAPDPVHVLADRAELNHGAQTASFFGRPARMWQGGSQVQAPVLELAQARHELSAHGDPGSPRPQVLTILMDSSVSSAAPHRPGASVRHAGVAAGGGAQPHRRAPAQGGGQEPRVVRVLSRDLVYSDEKNEVEFTGGVKIETADDTITTRSATAYLQAPTAAAELKPGSAAGHGPISMEGKIERVIAMGAVVLEQPGRRATGDRLVYTAADTTVLLTGSASAAPQVLDRERGTTVTAAAFRFRTDDESVEALSAVPNGAFTEQVRTQTPVKR